MSTRSILTSTTSHFPNAAETRKNSELLDTRSPSPSIEVQVAMSPAGILRGLAKAISLAKKGKEALDKTPLGRTLEESKPYRQRLKSLEKFLEYLEKQEEEKISQGERAREAREKRARERERFARENIEKSFTSSKPPTNPYDPEFFGVTGPGEKKLNVGKRYDPSFNDDDNPLGDGWTKSSEHDRESFEESFTSAKPPTNPHDPGFFGVTGPKPRSGPSDGSTGSDSFSGEVSDSGTEDIGSDSGGGSGSGWGVPVVLDLDGDGFEIIPLSQSTARFDIAGTGRRQVLAWVGPDDGLLVYDKDGDRVISDKDEIAFADYLKTAKTDLEGLAWFDQLAQGGNADGVLDGRDAQWSKFGVWRDADQDGETDPGELRMTDEGGLTSVNLTSDQTPQDAGPDAKVFGQGEYQFTDQNGAQQSGKLYDTALRHEPAPLSSNPTFLELYYHIKARDAHKGDNLN